MSKIIDRVISIALAEVGYLEKASNSQLDSKTANAGYNNWTKYARDLDALGNYYNGKKNGYAWCDVFVDWVFYKAVGTGDGRALNYQPLKSTGAGCYYSYQFYKAAGRTGKTPKLGAQIFFGPSISEMQHTGLVYDFDSSYVYTVEGNTSGANGVVANGGGVCQKRYSRTYGKIMGYGYPNYEAFPDEPETPTNPDRPPIPEWKPQMDLIKSLQTALNKQYSAGLKIDGIFGAATQKVLNAHILSTRLVNSKNQYSLWVQQRLVELGFKGTMGTPDGYYGPKTKASVIAFQKARGLVGDGEVGPKTALQLCIPKKKGEK